MPEGYVKMREKFQRDGLNRQAAQAKAARIWNSQHPGNPVGRHDLSSTKRPKADKHGFH